MSATVFYNATAELATLTNVFSLNGTPTDPTTVTLVTTDPAGVAVTYNWPGGPNTLTRTGAGAFKQDQSCASAVDGIWAYVWTGTGAASDVQAGTWSTFSTALNRNYCSAEELKSRLRISGTTDDSELALAVAGASRGIDLFCERQFYRSTETRTYVPLDLYRTRTDDLVSVTTLATDPSGTAPQNGSTFPVVWAASDFQLQPVNTGRTGEQWPFTRIRAVGTKTFPWIAPLVLQRLDRVQIAGVFGWPAVPYAVRTAALITASELFRMKDSPGGGSMPGEFAIAVVQGNPAVGQLLGPYVRHAFLAA